MSRSPRTRSRPRGGAPPRTRCSSARRFCATSRRGLHTTPEQSTKAPSDGVIPEGARRALTPALASSRPPRLARPFSASPGSYDGRPHALTFGVVLQLSHRHWHNVEVDNIHGNLLSQSLAPCHLNVDTLPLPDLALQLVGADISQVAVGLAGGYCSGHRCCMCAEAADQVATNARVAASSDRWPACWRSTAITVTAAVEE
jgi:hypothetical protein